MFAHIASVWRGIASRASDATFESNDMGMRRIGQPAFDSRCNCATEKCIATAGGHIPV